MFELRLTLHLAQIRKRAFRLARLRRCTPLVVPLAHHAYKHGDPRHRKQCYTNQQSDSYSQGGMQREANTHDEDSCENALLVFYLLVAAGGTRATTYQAE